MTAQTAEFVPVIAGFHPDPSICRVGEDYYLATSSFEYAPSVPLWHSRDLVSWTLRGNALTRDAQFTAGRSGPSGGIYAPTLRHHEGRFWLITTDVGDGGGQRLFWSEEIEGPWSDAILIPELQGIDPDLCWTDDGDCLVSYCSYPDGVSAVWQARIDPATGAVLDAPRMVWEGTELAHTEAPHLFRRGGWWYLLVAEGGTERGHGVSVARSRSPRGPFEAAPHNPVFSHRSSAHPVQNTGHLDLVQRPDGSWAGVHLGVRPRGASPGFHVLGRETFLCEVEWPDGWPQVTASAAPVVPGWDFEDRFEELHPRWVSPRERIESFSEPVEGGLRIVASSGGVYTRPQSLGWRASVELAPDPGSAVQVELRLDDRHRVGVRIEAGAAVGVWTVGGVEVELGRAPAPAGVVVGVAAVASASQGPDDVVVTLGDETLGTVDGRYLSTEVAGGFTGRMLGVRVERGAVLLRSVRVISTGS